MYTPRKMYHCTLAGGQTVYAHQVLPEGKQPAVKSDWECLGKVTSVQAVKHSTAQTIAALHKKIEHDTRHLEMNTDILAELQEDPIAKDNNTFIPYESE